MTRDELYFLLLMEEASEVQQRTSKLLRFGPNEIEPGKTVRNIERLRDEIKDFLSILAMLIDRGCIEPIQSAELVAYTAMRQARVEKYLAYSESLGRVREP